jgi:hypothetical protein
MGGRTQTEDNDNMDKLRQATGDWWDSIIAIIGALLTAINILSPLQIYGFIDNGGMRTLSLVLFLGFGVVAVLRARVSLNRYKNTLPEIVVFRLPTWELKEFSNKFRYALSIEFKNVPNHPSDNNVARNISAIVKWKDTRGNIVTENHGRWHITNRQRGLGHNMQMIDIYPNDQEVMLHFAIKSKDSQTLYAWNRKKDEADEQFELLNRFYNVEITLKESRGLKWTFIYLVENPELPEAPEIHTMIMLR